VGDLITHFFCFIFEILTFSLYFCENKENNMKKYREVQKFEKLLNDNDYYFIRSSGSHRIFKSKHTKHTISLPYHGKELKMALTKSLINGKIIIRRD
jgi:predicted RNA binding protein YcfA (HicA-like mRNA interferase family)